ncbi:ankyrin repeat-containing domain protein [Aspergillus pseudoustus]|uniref:Ankyrin repeat-containing domain protein n=1 Tax=Aspergillus pseudoustus TaxID=1810923 RepID=A0ABR4INI4_9EURO
MFAQFSVTDRKIAQGVPSLISASKATNTESPAEKTTPQDAIQKADLVTEESDPGYVSQDQASEETGENRKTNRDEAQSVQTVQNAEPEYEYALDQSHFRTLGYGVWWNIKGGDVQKLRSHLESSFVSESIVEYSNLMLGYAIYRRHATMLAECAKWLRQNHGDAFIKISSSLGLWEYTGFAIERRYDDIIQVLHDYFPSYTAEFVREFGSAAIRRNSLVMLKSAWRYLPDHNKFVQDNIHLAVGNSQRDVFRFMISFWDAGCAEGFEAALRHAIDCKNSKMVQQLCLFEGVDPRSSMLSQNRDFRPIDIPSPLSRAVSHGNLEILTMLLDKDEIVHRGKGVMPGLLEKALSLRHYEVAELLLARGADILEVSLDTAVEISGRERWKDTVKVLLQAGRRDFQSRFYGSVLQCACARGYVETAKLLLEYGHAINPKSPMALGGNSPLMGAIMGAPLNLVEFLISKGARVGDAQSVFGNALQTAVCLRCNDLISVLLKHTAHSDLDAILPQSRREPWFMNRVGGPGARFDSRSFLTPLALAVERANTELARILLEAGASRRLLSQDRKARLDEMLAETSETSVSPSNA